jgi:lipid A disaccharide synthetase
VPRAAARAALGVGADETVVAVLPGSRRSEIKYIAPRLFATLRRDAPRAAGLRFVVPSCRAARCRRGAARDAAADVPITLVDGRRHEALAACDVAIVASGTATLEAALFKRPMVVVYVMHILSWQMGKLVHYQPWISLPNILLRDHAVPELLQHGATPEKIAAAAFRWLDDPRGAIIAAALRGAAPRAAPRHRRARHRGDRSRPATLTRMHAKTFFRAAKLRGIVDVAGLLAGSTRSAAARSPGRSSPPR